MTAPPRLALLDRDGTINRKAPEGDYVEGADGLVLLPGAGQALARLNVAGIPVVVVTNQRGIALGRMTLEDLEAVHRRLDWLLTAEGARIDGYYACPHEQETCDCRKPAPGLLLRAAEDWGIDDLSLSAMIGDSASDVAAGRAVGASTVLVGSASASGADHVAPTLSAAVDWVLGG